jgi:hypothetical protein
MLTMSFVTNDCNPCDLDILARHKLHPWFLPQMLALPQVESGSVSQTMSPARQPNGTEETAP